MTVTDAPSLGRAIAATSFGFALVQLDVTIVNVALPAMGQGLGLGTAGLQWVVDAYTLVFAAALLSAGSLADLVGARRVYRAGLALFTLASLVCGLATGGGTLIAARALQGLGAAAMLPSSLALLNHACGDDPRRRGRAIGWWSSAASGALASGPLLGGLIVSWIGWRWIFLVNLPLGLLAAALLAGMPDTPVHPGRRLDLGGQGLATVGLGALTVAVIEAGPRGPADLLVLGAAVLAVASAAALVAVERRVADPMLPPRLFAGRLVTVSMVFGALTNVSYYGMMFVLSLFLQQVVGYSPAQAGLAFVPLTATFILVNMASGWVAGRHGARWPMAGGAAVAALGYALLAGLGPASPYRAMVGPFMLIPLGMGFAIPALYAAVLQGVERHLSGTASAAVNAARQAGGVVGVALFGALAADGRVAQGLHAAAITAAILMAAVAGLAAVALRARPNAAAPGG